jgi:hypothetical protein
MRRQTASRRLALALALATGCTPIPVGPWTPREPTASATTTHPNIYTKCAAIIGVRPCRHAEASDGRAIDSELAEIVHRNPGPRSPAPPISPEPPPGIQFPGKLIESVLEGVLKPFSNPR